MQFTVAFLAFLGLTLAQKEVYLNGLNMVHHALDSLDSGVAGLAAGADAAAATNALSAKSTNVLTAINNAIAAVNGASALDLAGAAELVSPSDHLVAETQKTVDDLIAKKEIIKAAGQTGLVLAQLKSQGVGAAKLVDAIAAKVPADAKSIATSAGDKIAAAISKGVTAFSWTLA